MASACRLACTATAWKWKPISSPPPGHRRKPAPERARPGVQVQQFVLNPLASAEVVLSETRNARWACCMRHRRRDDRHGHLHRRRCLAHHGAGCRRQPRHPGYRARFASADGQAEEIKKEHGYAVRGEVGADEYFNIRPFGEELPVQINRQDLAHIIEARVEEVFRLTLQEIKRSGYDGLLPPGWFSQAAPAPCPASGGLPVKCCTCQSAPRNRRTWLGW
jgi:hypothetical protein